MKILIVSDTHKSHKNLDKVLEIVKPIDMLIHLGDVEGEDDYIPVSYTHLRRKRWILTYPSWRSKAG